MNVTNLRLLNTQLIFSISILYFCSFFLTHVHLYMCVCVCVCVCVQSHFSSVQLFATLWTVACQAPLLTGYSKVRKWGRLPWHFPGDLPNPGTEPKSLTSPALASRFFTTEPRGKPQRNMCMCMVC